MSSEPSLPRTLEPTDPQKILTPANVVTLARICLVPVFVLILLSPWPEWMNAPSITEGVKRLLAALVFILISCTDWLDGYLARSRNEVTNFGKFVDPLADKILVAAALLALIELDSLPSWVVLIILSREFVVAGVRMIAAKEGVVIAASWWGKLKTVFQMIAIVLFTVKDAHMIGGFDSVCNDGMWLLSWGVMIVALVFTIVSMLDYIAKSRFLLGFKGSGPSARTKRAAEDLRTVAADENGGELARRVLAAARDSGLTIGTAESLTGGMICAALTALPGSSAFVKGGIVSYVNEVKSGVLAVDSTVLAREGAVCSEVAASMAEGARRALACDVAVSVTGIAGPTGAEPGKPVGTVWMGLSSARSTETRRLSFSGDRDEVRAATAAAALKALAEVLSFDEEAQGAS